MVTGRGGEKQGDIPAKYTDEYLNEYRDLDCPSKRRYADTLLPIPAEYRADAVATAHASCFDPRATSDGCIYFDQLMTFPAALDLAVKGILAKTRHQPMNPKEQNMEQELEPAEREAAVLHAQCADEVADVRDVAAAMASETEQLRGISGWLRARKERRERQERERQAAEREQRAAEVREQARRLKETTLEGLRRDLTEYRSVARRKKQELEDLGQELETLFRQIQEVQNQYQCAAVAAYRDGYGGTGAVVLDPAAAARHSTLASRLAEMGACQGYLQEQMTRTVSRIRGAENSAKRTAREIQEIQEEVA